MKTILASIFIIITIPVNAQIGNLLKQAGDQLKNKDSGIRRLLDKEAEKKQASLDSLDNNYAISFTDNSGLVNVHDKNEKALKGYNLLLKDENSKSDEEKLRDNLTWGKRLYASNKFILAGLQLHAAKIGYEETNRTRDINYFETLSNLGLLYASMGRLERAEEYTYEALSLREQNTGTGSPAYVASLNNRAVLYKEQGKFNEAEKDLRQVIELTQKLHGGESVHAAIALNNLAMLYQEVGRYKEAEELMQKTITISASQQNERSRNHERFLTNLAILQQLSGKYDAAEKTYLHVKTLQERFFKDKNNPELAHTLTNLASLYLTQGNLENIEPLLLEALEIYRKKFGNKNASYASAKSHLGNFYRGENDLDKAEEFLNEVVEIRRVALGENHPEYNAAVEDLALLYWKKNNYEKAIDLFTSSLDKSLDFITRYFPPMSEAEKTRFWDKLNSSFESFYAFTAEAKDTHPELLEKMFSYRMATKALLMSSAGKFKQEILNSNDKALKQIYQEWVDTKELIANAYSLSIEEQSEQEIDISSMEEKANRLERELSEKSSVFKKIVAPDSWPLERVQKQLKKNEAAVEIIYFNDLEGHKKKAQYAALIIKPAPQKPELVVIENGEQLEKRYFKYYHNAIKQKIDDEYSFDAFWKPLHDKLSKANKIYFSPDGIYSQINPNTLLTEENIYVSDIYSISILTTLREMEKKAVENEINDAVLIGYPSYGTASVSLLPGTREEIEQVNRHLAAKGYNISLFKDKEATEDNIKKVAAPKILHIATHGYFMEDSGSDLKRFGLKPGNLVDNPMLRSGLILANVGFSAEQQQMQGLSSKNNGLLTAYEAINLNLENTGLVVLSACETGLGEVKAGEGVYGLQRAFIVAGADAVIMSLWKVDDQATQLLMSTFYKEWLKQTDKLAAFKMAQQSLRKQYPHPFYWGAFVMVGK